MSEDVSHSRGNAMCNPIDPWSIMALMVALHYYPWEKFLLLEKNEQADAVEETVRNARAGNKCDGEVG